MWYDKGGIVRWVRINCESCTETSGDPWDSDSVIRNYHDHRRSYGGDQYGLESGFRLDLLEFLMLWFRIEGEEVLLW